MDQRDTTTLGSLVRAVRERAGLSLRDVATQVGISHGYLARIETGDRIKPSPDVLQKLADALDIDSWLLLKFFGVRPPALPPLRAYLHRHCDVTVVEADDLARLIEDRLTHLRKGDST